ncbi:MAG: hypothetical protein LBK29_02545 [Oscillospiraceae bacterium]|jgi:IS30 family transposase|nr:hypothetical protein [Oscillospiraceae bacterium]
MTNQEKEKITSMRGEGLSYSKIAFQLGISENTIKSFCRRNFIKICRGDKGESQNQRKIKSQDETDSTKTSNLAKCRQCSESLIFKRKTKKHFCSDKCRMVWWNSHPEAIKRKAYYHSVCLFCEKTFESYSRKDRKYCSRDCYIKAKVLAHFNKIKIYDDSGNNKNNTDNNSNNNSETLTSSIVFKDVDIEKLTASKLDDSLATSN